MYNLRITFKSIQKFDNIKKKLIKIKNKKKLNIYIKKNIFKIKNKKKLFTLLKSPHVNKKAREQFIYKNYVQKIEINFINIYELFNFIIILKKEFSKNFLINFKIIKINKKICL